MNFYLTNSDFEKMKNNSAKSKKEITGEMIFAKEGAHYILSKVEVYNNQDREFVESSSKKDVHINYENFLQRVLFDAYSSDEKEGVVVRFHSHPTALGRHSLAYPSDTDKDFIKSMQSSLGILNKRMGKKFVYVEGIITDSEIGFYYYDGKSVERIHTFIDFVEHIPKQPDNRSLGQIFVDGFQQGRRSNR